MTLHADEITPGMLERRDRTIATQSAQIEALTKALEEVRGSWHYSGYNNAPNIECAMDIVRIFFGAGKKMHDIADAALAAVGEKT